MAEPVLVRAYTTRNRPGPSSFTQQRTASQPSPTLPPISSFAFADILRNADSPDFQQAIDGIADIYSKSRLSLADEYGAHLPPQGEITAADSRGARKDVLRAGMKTALSSVPEGSSGSSEGSRKSRQRMRMLGFGGYGRVKPSQIQRRVIRIGSMGRSVTAMCTTALAQDLEWSTSRQDAQDPPSTTSSSAVQSLQRLLTAPQPVDPS